MFNGREKSRETRAERLGPIVMRHGKTSRKAFTLLELLVVITIIAILASLSLVAIAKVWGGGQKVEARRQIQALMSAVTEYHADTGTYPVSDGVKSAAATVHGDFTYGGAALNSVFGGPGAWSANNSEVVAILMDLQRYPGTGAPTVNAGHLKNLRQKRYLADVTMADAVNMPGVGPDLVYRDPWGNPYVVSFDLNFDEKCRDALYEKAGVSRQNGANGFYGLFNSSNANGMSDAFEYHGGVMIWSLGPDKKGDTNSANAGVNRDNILSWN